nr:3-keto-5-aminohexanoate cleavage protein [Rhodococcus wratislaviensis]GLK41261.1 3-keto-5-aminohexanoate cleavage protein [Rhodococcus wratislaviensis]
MAHVTHSQTTARKVIVTIAPTGGMATKDENPHLPVTPEEIADDIAACVDAGASIAAIHARRPGDLQATCNPDVYATINELTRSRCDVVINNSTGGGVTGDMIKQYDTGEWRIDFRERMKGLEAPGVEMATFDAETFVINGRGRELLCKTSPAECDEMAARMGELGIKPEWEVMNPAHLVQDCTRLIRSGFDSQPYWINVVLGLERPFQGAMPYTPRALHQMVEELPSGSELCVSAIGAAQLPAITHAVLLGGHIRVGLEDNLYYERGRLATNVELVERAVRIIRELGCEPATPAEARKILGLRQLQATATVCGLAV